MTGASGFVGSALCNELIKRGFAVRGSVRSLNHVTASFNFDTTPVGYLDANTDWSLALAGVDCVIHCASHLNYNSASESRISDYRSVNVEATRRLAEQASKAGVSRLVFISSIGVNGVHTNGRGPFTIYDKPEPSGNYAQSKWEAEQALWAVANKTGLEVVVVRPPLVYGAGVKGNLARLLKLVRTGMPLPLGAVHNQRSLIGLDNLVDLLIRCVDHPAAAGQTLLVSDDEDVSTPELIQYIASGLGRQPVLFPLPMSIIQLLGRITGKQWAINRLIGSLHVDTRHTCDLLDWKPPVALAEGIRRMTQSL